MKRTKAVSGLLAVVMVAVFVLVVLGKISWVAFWIVSAGMLGYVTYVLPSEERAQ